MKLIDISGHKITFSISGKHGWDRDAQKGRCRSIALEISQEFKVSIKGYETHGSKYVIVFENPLPIEQVTGALQVLMFACR